MIIDRIPRTITIKSRLENLRIALSLLKYLINTISAHTGIANKKIVIIISTIVNAIARFPLIYKAI
jgi:hypothetical protein